MADHLPCDLWITRGPGVHGADKVAELHVQSTLIGGESAVPTGRRGQVAARRVQRERQPAQPHGQRLGLRRRAGVRCGIPQHHPARFVGQRLQLSTTPGPHVPGAVSRLVTNSTPPPPHATTPDTPQPAPSPARSATDYRRCPPRSTNPAPPKAAPTRRRPKTPGRYGPPPAGLPACPVGARRKQDPGQAGWGPHATGSTPPPSPPPPLGRLPRQRPWSSLDHLPRTPPPSPAPGPRSGPAHRPDPGPAQELPGDSRSGRPLRRYCAALRRAAHSPPHRPDVVPTAAALPIRRPGSRTPTRQPACSRPTVVGSR